MTPVLLCSGLGGAAAFWAPQLAALGERFRPVTYDQLGTGSNPAVLPEGYSIGDMADEVAVLLDGLGIEACHFVGHALGGAVGIEFARRYPKRLLKLAIVNGWAKMDAVTARCFETRLALLRDSGVAAYVRAQAIFLYPAAWMSANAERMTREDAHGVAHFQGAENLLARIGALQAWEAGDLASIGHPVLALAARDDVLVPWTASRTLAEALPDARLVVLDEGCHACTVTAPDASNAALLHFLAA